MGATNKQRGSGKIMAAIAALALALAACGAKPETNTAASPSASAAASPSTAATVAPSAKPSAAAETEAQLYEKAKQEGKVVVYTASTGVTNKAKASFEKQYPEVKVELFSLGTQALMDKVIQEQKAGIYNADFILIKENGGAIKHEMVDSGMFAKYFPEDIAAKTIEPYNKEMGYVSFLLFKTVMYNTNVFPKSPVGNWWDLTTPEWKGLVAMIDPAKGGPQLDFLTAFVNNADEVKQAYKDKFGQELALGGTENAGYEFIKQLEKNAVLFKNEDDLIAAVAKSDQAKPMVGIGNSDDLQTVNDNKWPVGFAYDIKPRLSVINPAYLFLAKNAAHPNAAKLLLRWMAGGADGQAEGLNAVIQQGAWVTRTDKKTNNPVELSQVKLWPYDSAAFYANTPKVTEFWLKLQ